MPSNVKFIRCEQWDIHKDDKRATPGSADNCDSCAKPDTTNHPIRYANGEIIRTETDLIAPRGGFLGLKRFFSNRMNSNFRGPLGYGWMVNQWPYVFEFSSGNTVVVMLGNEPIWFDKASGVYTARYGLDQTYGLTADSTNKLFVLTESFNGRYTTIEFHDFTQTAKPQGKMKRHIDSTGVVTSAASYFGEEIEELQQAVTVSGTTTTHSILASFYGSGDYKDQVQYFTLRKKVGAGSWTNLRRASYVYYAPSVSYGTVGDLKTVTIQVPNGGGWSDASVSYYRYYKSGDSGGYEHALKYVVGPGAYQRMVAASIDPLTASNGTIDSYRDFYYEYDSDQKVTIEAAPDCPSCGSSGGTSGDDFTRTVNGSYPGSPTDRFNTWKYKTVLTQPDTNTWTVYTNDLGQVMLKVFEDVVGGNGDKWRWFTKYDSGGRIVMQAMPSAVTGHNEAYDDLLHYTSGNYQYLADSAGFIQIFEYYSSTGGSVDEDTSGSVKDYLQFEKIKNGETGTAIKRREYEYYKRVGSNGETVYPIAKETVYPSDTNQSLKIETSYAYEWFSGTTTISKRTTTLPSVASGQNGPGSSATREEVFDTFGNLTWTKDERGYITKMVYDAPTGRMTQRIDDVDTSQTSDEPSGWTTPGDGGKHLVTDYTYDDLGRLTQTLGPSHTAVVSGSATTVRHASWTVYKEATTGDQTWSASGYATGSSPSYTYTLVNPVSLTLTDKDGRTTDSIVSKRTTGSGALSSSDTFAQTDFFRWTSNSYSNQGRLTATRVYHTIPSSGVGSSGAPGNGNYDESLFGYDVDMGRQIRSVTPGGTITRTVYDALGRVSSVWVGTDDVPSGGGATWADWSPTNTTGTDLVKVSENEYDGGSDEGDSNLTEVTMHVDGSTTRVTSYTYDWRNRRTIEDGEVDHCAKSYYDNLDRVIKSERYNTTTGGNLIARSETAYDDRGRVYETTTYAVDPSNGSVGNALTGNNWYDAAGNLIKSISPGSGKVATKSTYDSLGRTVKSYTGYDTSESSYGDADDVTGDTILQQAEYTYNEVGQTLLVTTRQRLNDATGTGELTTTSGSNPKARVSFAAMWYDGAGRSIAACNYGTNNDTTLSRPTTPPSRSDTELVTTTDYNDAGEAYKITDPKALETRTTRDHAGRVTQTVENYDDGDPTSGGADKDRTTKYAYNSDGKVITLTACQQTAANADDQITTYVYGSTTTESDIASSQLLRAVIYPDSDDVASPLGNGTDTIYDRVEYKYNRLGQVKEIKDQNASVRTLEYDALGRLLHDRVTTVGSGVDNAVLRISRTYEVRGMVEKVTSVNNATVGSGTVVNEVQYAYNTFGQLTADYQAHGGAVNTGSSPKVQYAYASGGSSSNQIRPTTLTYPNAKVITYDYGSANSLNDILNRIGSIIDDDGGSTHLADYTYVGVGMVVRRDHPEPGFRLDLWGGTTGTFAGLDRFSRVIDQRWVTTGGSPTDLDRIKHGYDRNSNRLYRENTVATANTTNFDEFYTYDGLNRLVTADRGTLDGGKTGLVSNSRTFKQNWSLDPLGNWSTFQEDANGDGDYTDAGDLNQTRTHNKVNELLTFSESGGQVAWADCVYDRNGNMTTISKPASPANTFTAKYDAWNRLVELTDTTSTYLVAKYEYDGLTRRTVKKTYNAPTNSNLLETRHFYYTTGWQNIEERVSTNAYADRIHVWGLRYIDELILRDRDADLDGSHTLEERLYATQDANFNLTAISDDAGSVQERYSYASYGVRAVLTPAFASRGLSSLGWGTGHQGLLLDGESALIYNRNRYFSSHIAEFMQRDPASYAGGHNLLEYCGSRPQTEIDPKGLQSGIISQFFGNYVQEIVEARNWVYTGTTHPAPGVYDASVDAAGKVVFNGPTAIAEAGGPGGSYSKAVARIQLWNQQGDLAFRVSASAEAHAVYVDRQGVEISFAGASIGGEAFITGEGLGASAQADAHAYDVVITSSCFCAGPVNISIQLKIRFFAANADVGAAIKPKSTKIVDIHAGAMASLLSASTNVELDVPGYGGLKGELGVDLVAAGGQGRLSFGFNGKGIPTASKAAFRGAYLVGGGAGMEIVDPTATRC